MSKRGDNIRHRSDGRWEAKYVKERRNGRAIYGYLYAQTYSEVKLKREKVCAGLENVISRRDKKSFMDIAESFLLQRESLVKQSTLARYRSIVNTHLKTEFSNTCISYITSDMIDEFAERLRNKGRVDKSRGLCEKSIRDIITLALSIIEYAKERGDISGVTRKIVLPKSVKKPINVFSIEEQKVIEDYMLALFFPRQPLQNA